MDVMTSIGLAVDILAKLKKVCGAIKEADVQILFAELQSQFANVKNEASDLKIELANLKEENLRLKNSLLEKPEVKNGTYVYPEDSSRYCTACFDGDQKKVRLQPYSHHLAPQNKGFKCPICQNTFFEF